MAARLFAALTLFLAVSIAQAQPVRLTFDGGVDRNPAWTPDGQQIYFESTRDGGYDIYRIPAAGGEVTRITETGAAYWPTVSPDGNTLVFSYKPEYAVHLFRANPDGSSPQQLTFDFVEDWTPEFSPDGNHIYFSRRVDEFDYDIYRIPSGGGSPQFILGDDGQQTWGHLSPDGTRIAFETKERMQNQNVAEASLVTPSDPWIFHTQILYNSNPGGAPDAAGGLDWSPDGTRLIYTKRISDHEQMLVEDLPSGQITVLLEGGRIGQKAYSPDGSRLVFTWIAPGESQWDLYLLDLDNPPPPPAGLTASGSGDAGASGLYTVTMTSASPIAALQFAIEDLPEGITATGVTAVGRAAGMDVAFADDGGTSFLLYSAGGGSIPAGDGPILEVAVDVAGDAAGEIQLVPGGVVSVGPGGTSVPLVPGPGVFAVASGRGDINGDGDVDVADLVRLVEIILGIGDPATPGELAAADCNGDGAVDAFDVVCLVDLILPGPDPEAIAGELYTLVAHEEIRGLEFEFPRGVAGALDTRGRLETRVADLALRDRAVAYARGTEGIAAGTSQEILLAAEPVVVRAYGPGGRSLHVTVEDREIRVGGNGAGLQVQPARPNPFLADGTTLRFSLAEGSTVGIRIHDLRGAVVADLGRAWRTAGTQEITWDGRGADGAPVPAGIYFARIEAGEEGSRTVKLVRVTD